MRKYIFTFLACLSISFSSLIVEAAATGEYSYDGMGRIVLEKNMVNNVNALTQDMLYKGETGHRVPNTNTIFIIQYDFVLAEDITIPEGCVLKFDGGSISGTNTLTFSKTSIEGNPKILCSLAGNLEKADITWFGAEDGNKAIDSGEIINKVAAVTNHIIIPTGTYYIINYLVEITGSQIIEWYGSLCYIGKQTNISVFTIGKLVSLNMHGTLDCLSPSVNYIGEFGSNIRGLVVKNLVQRKVIIGEIRYFNINLMLIGEGAGCCYNTFYINALMHGNTGILVTQKNSGGHIGWANENTFIGGRIKNYSSWDYKNCESHAIVVKGIYNDDSYNKCNSLYFLRQCVEGSFDYIPLVLNNVQFSSFLGLRTEGVSYAAKLSGSCCALDIKSEYGTENMILTELSQCEQIGLFKSLPILNNITLDVDNPILGTKGADSYIPKGIWGGMNVYATERPNVSFSSANNLASNIGFKVIFANSENNTVSINMVGKEGIRRRIYVNPIKKFDGTVIPRNTTRESSVIRARSLTWNSVYNYFTSGTDIGGTTITFDPTVKEVWFTFTNVSAVNVQLHTSGYVTYP